MNVNLQKALLAAQKSFKGIECDKTTGEYPYVSAEKMMEDCRGILHKHRLLAYRTLLVVEPDEDVLKVRVRSAFVLDLISAKTEFTEDKEDGWLFSYTTIARARHGLPLDKSVSAQATIMWSMFFRDILLIPRFDPSEAIHEKLQDVPIVPAGEFKTERPKNGAAAAAKE